MTDADVATGGKIAHWLAFDMPTTKAFLPQRVPRLAFVNSTYQGINDYGMVGYKGPCPSVSDSDSAHRYYFSIIALSQPMGLDPAGVDYDAFLAATSGRIVATAELMGTYSRAAAENTTLTLTSSAFANGQTIPQEYTCDGLSKSPPLIWENPPPGTQSFALLLTDFEAQTGENSLWALYDIPVSKDANSNLITKYELEKWVAIGLTPDLDPSTPENPNTPTIEGGGTLNPFTAGSKQARNDITTPEYRTGTPGYSGPCPASGSGAHRYTFKLAAVDALVLPDLPSDPTFDDVAQAIQGRTLGSVELTGYYERQTGGVGAFKLTSPVLEDNGILPKRFRSGYAYQRFISVWNGVDNTKWGIDYLGTMYALHDVAYGTAKTPQFVAVGENGVIRTSVDGLAWTWRASGTRTRLNGVAAGNGKFIVVGDSGLILASTDGIDWNPVASGISNELYKIIWTGSLFVSVGENGTIMSSPDGQTWSRQTSNTSNHLYAVVWNGAKFVATGYAGTILTGDATATTWTASTSGVSYDLNTVAWGNSKFIALGTGGAQREVEYTIPTICDDDPLTDRPACTYVYDYFWDSSVISSPTGDTWTETATISVFTGQTKTQRQAGQDVIAEIEGISWNGNRFVAVGSLGTVAVSVDGINWNTDHLSTDAMASQNRLTGIIWNGATFMAVGERGVMTKSQDGFVWSDSAINRIPVVGSNLCDRLEWGDNVDATDTQADGVEGSNISPPLQWSNVPAGTKSLALFLKDEETGEDEDAPWEGNTHWVVYNIPPTLNSFPEDVAKVPFTIGSYQGKNGAPWAVHPGAPQTPPQQSDITTAIGTYGALAASATAIANHYEDARYYGYWGPCWPHRYVFTLVALSVETISVDPPTYTGIIAAMKGRVIGTAEVLRSWIPAP